MLAAETIGCVEIFLGTPLDMETAFGDVGEESFLGARPHVSGHEIVDFRQDGPGKNPSLRVFFEEIAKASVVAVVGVYQGHDRTRVGDDHRRPNPDNSSSAFSERFRRPLLPAPTLRAFLLFP